MKTVAKGIKRQLRELADQAYERELGSELARLAARFDEWREGKISAGELSYLIHQYHKGPSRELYGRYNNVPVEILVAYAIANHIIDEQDIADELLPYVQNALQFYRSFEDDEETEAGQPAE